jgi:hypothetical protein
MNIEEFSKNIENEINENQLTPTTRWHFLLKNYVIWLFAFLATLLGSLAVSTIIFLLTEHDWDVFRYLNQSLFEYIFISIPYIWLAFLILLVFIIQFNVIRTKRGYRYKTSMVLIGSIVFSVILGSTLFLFGIDSEIHEIFLEQIPLYKNSIYTKENIWIFPEKGLLSGTITTINDDGFTLIDLNKKMWEIKISDKTEWEINPIPKIGEKIKLIGIQNDIKSFSALIIRPWNKNG